MSRELGPRLEVFPDGLEDTPGPEDHIYPIEDIIEGVGRMGLIYNPTARGDMDIYKLELSLYTVGEYLEYKYAPDEYLKKILLPIVIGNPVEGSACGEFSRQYSSLIFFEDSLTFLHNKDSMGLVADKGELQEFISEKYPSDAWLEHGYSEAALQTIILAYEGLSERSRRKLTTPQGIVNELAEQIASQSVGRPYEREQLIALAWTQWEEKFATNN